MRLRVKGIFKSLLAILTGFILGTLLWKAVVFIWEITEPESAILIPPTETEQVEDAILYHGDQTKPYKEKGKWYFKRDGKQCRLFTQNFNNSKRK